MIDTFGQALSTSAQNLYNFVKYLASVIVDGKANNVWLTLMPPELQSALYDVGVWLSGALGFGA